MLAIDEEKFPPPKPAVAAHASNTHTWVPWACAASQPLGTTTARRTVGTNSSAALTVVHARPPNLGTARVYGIRKRDPTRFGVNVRRKSSETDSVIPAFPRLSTTTVQSTQTQN